MTDLEAILEAIKAQPDTPPPWFDRWQAEVYGRDEVGKQTARSTAAEVLRDQHAEEGVADTERWKKNEEAHFAILNRLDALNGWRNKVMGVSTFVVFCGPLAVAIWALLTR